MGLGKSKLTAASTPETPLTDPPAPLPSPASDPPPASETPESDFDAQKLAVTFEPVSNVEHPLESDNLLAQVQFLPDHLLWYMEKHARCTCNARERSFDQIETTSSQSFDSHVPAEDIQNITYNPSKVAWTPILRQKFVKSFEKVGVQEELSSRHPEMPMLKIPSDVTKVVERDTRKNASTSNSRKRPLHGEEDEEKSLEERLAYIESSEFLRPLTNEEKRQRKLGKWVP